MPQLRRAGRIRQQGLGQCGLRLLPQHALRDGETLSQIGQIAPKSLRTTRRCRLAARASGWARALPWSAGCSCRAKRGNWNEWHLLFDGGGEPPKVAWLSEDNGSLRPEALKCRCKGQRLPPTLAAGPTLSLAGQPGASRPSRPRASARRRANCPRRPNCASFPSSSCATSATKWRA